MNGSIVIHPKDFFVKFSGDVNKLNEMGYEFQALYAANYEQWNKDDVRIWIKGEDVTHDEFGGKFPVIFYLLSRMDINNIPSKDSDFLIVYVNRKTYELTLDSTPYYEAREKVIRRIASNDWSEIYLNQEILKPLLELMTLKWVSLEKRQVINNKLQSY